ncbi:MAG: hypothetical protein JXA18_10815 [Chitinispirillaceae bacterium]|nr:hypothetical protein [Chitinispirillaceae bacterium]
MMIVLVPAVMLITWYGNRDSNIPFRPAGRIIISGNNDNLSLYHYVNDKALVILPFDTGTPLPAAFPLPEQWSLVSRSESIAAGLFPHPPKAWRILDTITHSMKQPAQWPLPRSFRKNSLDNCLIESLHPFNDQRNALNVTLAGTAIIVIDASKFLCTPADTTRLREKNEIVVIINADSRSAVRCRSIFRPYFTIAFGTFDKNIPSYQNLLLCSTPAAEQFIFRTAGKQRIVFQGRSGAAPHVP